MKRYRAANPIFGEKNPNWKGGKRMHHSGYILIYRPNHPFARTDGKMKHYVLEHRLVIEQYLRENNPTSVHLVEINGEKYLGPEVVIHHRDRDRSNNSFSNLEIMLTQSEHITRHNYERSQDRVLSANVREK